MPAQGPPPGWLGAAPGTPERDTPKKHIAHDNTMYKWLDVLSRDNRLQLVSEVWAGNGWSGRQ